MWIPAKAFELFHISKDTVDALRAENAAVNAENSNLKSELASVKSNFNWLTVRVNALEIERAALLEKVSGVKIAVPEVVRQVSPDNLVNQFTFEDMGDDLAKHLGLPTYGN